MGWLYTKHFSYQIPIAWLLDAWTEHLPVLWRSSPVPLHQGTTNGGVQHRGPGLEVVQLRHVRAGQELRGAVRLLQGHQELLGGAQPSEGGRGGQWYHQDKCPRYQSFIQVRKGSRQKKKCGFFPHSGEEGQPWIHTFQKKNHLWRGGAGQVNFHMFLPLSYNVF